MPIRHRILSNLTGLVAAIVIAALIVAVPSSLLAQQSAATPKAVAKAAPHVEEDEESSPTAKKPGDEGIKVHGHWIIDVKDKDGKIVEHRDFQNALANNGAALLGTLLLGQATPDQSLYIVVGGGTNSSYYMNGANSLSAAACATLTANHCLTNLTQQQVNGGLTLTSQFQATVADTFTYVSTNLYLCYIYSTTSGIAPDTVAPTSCKAGFPNVLNSSTPTTATTQQIFTLKDLTVAPSTPLSVLAGQTVQVTVTLTFS